MIQELEKEGTSKQICPKCKKQVLYIMITENLCQNCYEKKVYLEDNSKQWKLLNFKIKIIVFTIFAFAAFGIERIIRILISCF